MSFANIYYKRAVATAKACYVCYRPTTTVLATINTVDFLYTCPAHLTDFNFASRIADDTAGTIANVSVEEIEKIKKEYEEKQKLKAEKAKEKAAADKDQEKDKGKHDGTSKEASKSPTPSGNPGTPSTPKPTHERYSLHRDFFAMRQREHKKRRQAAQTKDLAPRLPVVPSGSISPHVEDKY